MCDYYKLLWCALMDDVDNVIAHWLARRIYVVKLAVC